MKKFLWISAFVSINFMSQHAYSDFECIPEKYFSNKNSTVDDICTKFCKDNNKHYKGWLDANSGQCQANIPNEDYGLLCDCSPDESKKSD